MDTTMKIMSKKVLVVYYSLTGNTKLIAKAIAKEVDADILEIKPEKDVKPFGLMKYIIGGKDVLFNKKPKINDLDFPPQLYQVIFIGSPVWANSYAPAINTFFSQEEIEDKKVCLFGCHGGGGAEKMFDKMKDTLEGNEILGEKDFKDPIKGDKEEAKRVAGIWAQGLLSFLEDEENPSEEIVPVPDAE